MLSRRDFLKVCTGAACALDTRELLCADGPSTQCRPVISGPLWWASPNECTKWGTTGWRKELDAQKALGFDLLWLTQSPRLLENLGFGLRDLLDLCAERKVQVILDTGYSGNWYTPLDLKKELELCRNNSRLIGGKVSGHPAFYAWYIPHEIYMGWGAMDDYVKQLYPALTEACKKAANLPVTLSPFFILDRTKVFGDFQFNEPDEYRQYWAALIRNSGLDVIMMQDSGEHFSYVSIEERRPFFEAMSQACKQSGARFWGNVEVAEMECPSLQEYVRRYGRVHHSTAKGISWRPVPIERLKQKLALASEYCERIVSWGYQEFCRPALGTKAAAWYNGYREYVRQTEFGTTLKPS